MPRRIVLLGSTGSIGTQALDVISKFPEEFEVKVLTAGSNVGLLAAQAKKFRPEAVVIGKKDLFHSLRDHLKNTGIRVFAGEDEMEQVVAGSDAEIALAAIVGYSGLRHVVAAIKSGKNIALANKETLVAAGEYITQLARSLGTKLIPVDSEHSAIFQCLAGEQMKSVEKITLTASGGPFLDLPVSKLSRVKPEDALKHPNWNMGDKITVDSASMMNKGLEVIEARWLFDISPDNIKVIIHPQSIIHSFVHFADGSVKAQMALPDMRIPILYALGYPVRMNSGFPRLDLASYPAFTFLEPDPVKFRNLSLAYSSIREGGNKPCVLNASNEVAVSAFLSGKINFMQIPDIVEHTLENSKYIASPLLEELEATDSLARKTAQKFVQEL